MSLQVPRILVADDDERDLSRIVRALQPRGYEVVTACDGREALARLRAETFDLLVLDVMMPYVDGIEVLKARREEALHPGLPILAMSVRAAQREFEEWVRDLVLGWGARELLLKPLNPKQLIALVEQLLAENGVAIQPSPGEDAG